MKKEIISKKTRNALREVLVGWVLREIEMEFEGAGIQCDRSYEPSVGGARRSFVEQHYRTLDFANADAARRLLVLLESVLNKESRKLADQPDNKYARQRLDDLIDTIKGDGVGYTEGRISPTTVETRKVFSQASDRSISEVTRRNITDNLRILKARWWGRLPETDFLERIYDLKALPSTNGRFKDALGDIFQHRENNLDWDDYWVFTDGRLSLMDSDEAFLRFLCEMVHPVVRPDADEVRELVQLFNDHLAKDGWDIYEAESISGKPVFQARRKSTGFVVARQVKVLTEKVDSAYIDRQTDRMTESVEGDPELAIGTAKELVESVCKMILHERGVPFSKNADLPELNKATFKSLRLVPDDIPDHAKGADTIKRMLSNLASVTQGLAELRNLYGTGHGKHGRTKSVHPRHARLAVGTSSTLAAFLYETHLQNQQKQEPTA